MMLFSQEWAGVGGVVGVAGWCGGRLDCLAGVGGGLSGRCACATLAVLPRVTPLAVAACVGFLSVCGKFSTHG